MGKIQNGRRENHLPNIFAQDVRLIQLYLCALWKANMC